MPSHAPRNPCLFVNINCVPQIFCKGPHNIHSCTNAVQYLRNKNGTLELPLEGTRLHRNSCSCGIKQQVMQGAVSICSSLRCLWPTGGNMPLIHPGFSPTGLTWSADKGQPSALCTAHTSPCALTTVLKCAAQAASSDRPGSTATNCPACCPAHSPTFIPLLAVMKLN